MATPCPGVSDERKAPQGTVSGGRGAVGGKAAGLTEHLELEKSGLLAAYMCHPGRSRTSSLLCLGFVPVGLGRNASLTERLEHILVARVPGVCAGGWDVSLSQGQPCALTTQGHAHHVASGRCAALVGGLAGRPAVLDSLKVTWDLYFSSPNSQRT